MKVRLLHPDRDFDPRQAAPAHADALTQDLDLEILIAAMAGGDEFLRDVSRRVLLGAPQDDLETIRYRQEVLRDCLQNPAAARALYDLSVKAVEQRKKSWFGFLARSPGSILYEGIQVIELLMGQLRALRRFAEEHGDELSSRGFSSLLAVVRAELSEEYLAEVRGHLADLKFPRGLALTARLGERLEGNGYVLHRISAKRGGWLEWLFRRNPRGLLIQIAERDQAGMRALSEIRERGINSVANALAQSGDHVVAFFELLRAEMAFYVACLNLHTALQQAGTPLTLPRPAPTGERQLRFEGLRDACLSLRLGSGVVGNDLAADGKSLGIVTGANQGGKSTFLRSLGLAQLMMQAGMFVAARSFSADVSTGIFTHFRREEDRTMKSGKLDEELARMSALVDAIAPDALVLLNESFSATNEREGSEIATQIVCTLAEKRIKVFFVTHLHAFARALFEAGRGDAIFLRAERRPDGARTFRIQEGEPLETAFGADVYQEVFAPGADDEPARPPSPTPVTLVGSG